MPVPQITLYVDAVSPFGYVVYHLFRNDPIFKNCDITYVPIFLGGLMKACKNTPPIHVINKDVWTDKERRRYAKMFNVPMKEAMPPNFPILTLNLMRQLASLREIDGNQKRMAQALDVLFYEFWAKHTEIHKPEVFHPILAKILGEQDAKHVADFANDQGKAVLSENTNKAFQEKAFGLPWIVCTNSDGRREAFWGVDHLGFVLAFLGLEKPSTGPWKALL